MGGGGHLEAWFMTGGHGGGCDMERLWMPLGGFWARSAVPGDQKVACWIHPSIHPPASGSMSAKPKARQGKKKKEDCRHRHEDGVCARAYVCVCVCACKGPGNGHVTDARKEKGAVGWTGTPWLARQGQPWRGWRRKRRW